MRKPAANIQLREHTLADTKIVWSPGPVISRFNSHVASSKAKRAMCTAGNVGSTGNSAGPLASSDSLGRPCWFIQSLIVLEDSTIRAVGPSRL